MNKTVAMLTLGTLVALALVRTYCFNPKGVLSIEGPDPAGSLGAVVPPDPASLEVLDRIQKKQQTVNDFLAERIDRTEAVARFRAINTASPKTLALMRRLSPGVSEEELNRRNLEMYLETNRRVHALKDHREEAPCSPSVEEGEWD
jgi:hypothetical protein